MRNFLKYPLLLLCLSAYVSPVSGQAILALLFGKNIKNDNLTLGIHVALQPANLTNTPGADFHTGISFGAYTNVKLSDNWTLSNYFIFKSPRGATSIPQAYQIQPDVPIAADAKLTRKLTYMEISPLMRYSLTTGLSVAAGPQFAIRTVAKEIYELTLPDGGEETLIYHLRDKYALIDVDVAADVQYAFLKGQGIRLNLRFSQGLVNIYKDEIPLNAKNYYFQFGVGIPIATGSTKNKIK
ncbi:MAG TPA: hypothetical protein VGN20_05705 [Mucilaginibacter sp.]|jgi:hypothetical protein